MMNELAEKMETFKAVDWLNDNYDINMKLTGGKVFRGEISIAHKVTGEIVFYVASVDMIAAMDVQMAWLNANLIRLHKGDPATYFLRSEKKED